MTRTEAYNILRLPYGSSKEEIQEQFSKLAVQFKPDESPEEFMKIHTAYKLLTDISSPDIGNMTDIFDDSEEQINDEWNDVFQQLDEDFDAEEERRKKEEEERKQQEQDQISQAICTTMESLKKIIFEKDSYKNTKALKMFFKSKALRSLLPEPEFIDEVKALFDKKEICYEYCSVLLKAYDFYIEDSTADLRRIAMRKFLLNKLYTAKDMLPGDINWNLFSSPVMLFAFLNLCYSLSLVENLFHIVLLVFFILFERFLRVFLHWRKFTAYNVSSLICVVIVSLFSEYYVFANNMNPDGSMIIFCVWLPYTFVVGFIAFKRFLMRSSYRNNSY